MSLRVFLAILLAFTLGVLIDEDAAGIEAPRRVESTSADLHSHDVTAYVAGLLDRPRVPVPVTTPVRPRGARKTVRAASVSVWDALALCESHGNWQTNTGNGYSGGLQMDAQFWSSYGGLEFAAEAWQATREEQIVVAERGRAARGFHPWPTCARKLGLI